MVADGSAKGRADPAYTAHTQVIVFSAMNAWNRWIDVDTPEAAARDEKVKTVNHGRQWQKVHGPIAGGRGLGASTARHPTTAGGWVVVGLIGSGWAMYVGRN